MHEHFWTARKLAESSFFPIKQIALGIYDLWQFLGGSRVPLCTVFNGQPYFPHGIYGIFISNGAKIGRNCVIFQHVTIGSNTLPKSKGFGFPTIGDNCYIGAGAKIIGNITIGDNVRIGANAVVYKDVPSNSVVTSGEQVIRPAKDLDNRFYFIFKGVWRYFEDGKWHNVTDPHLFENKEQPF